MPRATPPASPFGTRVLRTDPSAYAPSAERPVRVKAQHMRAATRTPAHSHSWAQLAYSSAGVLRVTAWPF